MSAPTAGQASSDEARGIQTSTATAGQREAKEEAAKPADDAILAKQLEKLVGSR